VRLSAAFITALVCALLAGCSGGQGDDTAATGAAEPSPRSIEALWRAPGEDVALVPGTSDYAPGPNRVSFLVVDDDGRTVEETTARVWVARDLGDPPFLQTTARLETIGVPGEAPADAEALYVTEVELPDPGTYWLLAEPVGDTEIQALGTLVVERDSAAPGIGDRAPPSETPTLESAAGDLSKLSTGRAPSAPLYRVSVADAIAAGDPVVVAFATPQYCETRTCGPVVDVVDAVRKRYEKRGIRFVHVEVYQDNDPANGVNRWVVEWELPTEPFTFVVDREGIVRARLEGAFSARELEHAIDALPE
jgi:hypothetical protein